MKILCFSDWHLANHIVDQVVDGHHTTEFTQRIVDVAWEQRPDVIVVTGDTVTCNRIHRLNALLHSLFPSTPVIATLGNHEFWGDIPWRKTLWKVSNQDAVYDNVHILDLNPSDGIEVDGYNFVGGALFFDGSMKWKEDDDIVPWDGWNDWHIMDIETEYKKLNKWYVTMIRKAFRKNMPNILCTHHVPHIALNAHEPSHYSFYTGMRDVVSKLPFDDVFPNALICGHTHKRIIGEVVPGFYCVNVGSTYGMLRWYLLEL